MKTLIIGSGGREHAIVWSLRRTNPQLEIYCSPGNGGIAEMARCVSIQPTEQAALVQFAKSEGIDLTVVGPEGPLVAGLVDAFEGAGLNVFGPNSAAARLEGSKAFAKEFMARNGIPTAAYRIANSPNEALDIVRSRKVTSLGQSVVIKASALAAGKGVIVANSQSQAEKGISELAGSGLAGTSDKPFVIEEALVGREASVLVFADGRDYVLMPPARDHKRIGENDTGPNTGGMGSITDSSILDAGTLEQVISEIIEPTLEGAQREGFPFKGVLFFGLMLTADGPKVLEYNVRFGDPETQAILVRLRSDLLTILRATRERSLAKTNVQWTEGSSACIVLANRGYPGKHDSGAVIHGLGDLKPDDIQVFHAGTEKSSSGDFVATGGRVLGVTCAGLTLAEALGRCYAAVNNIRWDGMQFRRDIGRFTIQQSTTGRA